MLSTNIRKYTDNIKGSFTFTAYVERDATDEEIDLIKTYIFE